MEKAFLLSFHFSTSSNMSTSSVSIHMTVWTHTRTWKREKRSFFTFFLSPAFFFFFARKYMRGKMDERFIKDKSWGEWNAISTWKGSATCFSFFDNQSQFSFLLVFYKESENEQEKKCNKSFPCCCEIYLMDARKNTYKKGALNKRKKKSAWGFEETL